MKPFLDPFPFRTPENRSSIGDVISEITSRGEQPKGYAKVEKIPAPIPPSKSGKRYDKVGKVTESHSRAALEKLSTTELRELKKKYERMVLRGDRKASEELATVRGLLRSKGGGHALDEAATPCERAALARLKSANTADLQDKPGAAGERAHARLHKTIGKVLKNK
jgi:hypothetical protein